VNPLTTGFLTLLVLATAACSPGRGRGAISATTSTAAPLATVPVTTATSLAHPSTTVPRTAATTIDPGLLPQTDAVPAGGTRQFGTEMAALWQGVVQGSLTSAKAAFFPEAAYVQVKTVANPAGDWQARLVEDFALDLAAAHQLLGGDASSDTLLGVDVPSGYAHWVPAGVCDNRVGYYEVADSRLVYSDHGVVRSFGIASLISWRGEWYVVHLGAIVRSGSGGAVDDPEEGPGTSAPSTTC
jgi:hypothetical protein